MRVTSGDRQYGGSPNGPSTAPPAAAVSPTRVYIYFDKPTAFYLDDVETQLNDTLKDGGVHVRVSLNIGDATGRLQMTGTGAARAWNNNVIITDDPIAGGACAYLNGGITIISNQSFVSLLRSDNPEMRIGMANMIIHEVFWLGVLGENDEGTPGTFPSGTIDHNNPVDLRDWASKINNRFDVP